METSFPELRVVYRWAGPHVAPMLFDCGALATLLLTSAAETPSTPAPAPASAGLVLQAGPEGYGFGSADGANSLLVHPEVQADYSTIFNDAPKLGSVSNTFYLSFAGFQLDARLARLFHTRMLVDFSAGRLTLLDAWVEANLWPELTVRVGKFQFPIDEEALTPKIWLPFISYGFVSFLLPIRDTGLQLLGTFGDGVLSYNSAVVNGATAGTLNESDLDSDKDLVGHLYLQPFRHTGVRPVEELGLGFGASWGQRSGNLASPQLPVLGTYAGRPFFSYRSQAFAEGSVTRLVPEVQWACGPVALYANYIHDVEHPLGVSVLSQAWNVVAALVLTGEAANALVRTVPEHPLDVAQGHFGAVVLNLGSGSVTVGANAFPTLADPAVSMRRASVVGAGLSWYPVAGVGLLADYSHTFFSAADGAAVRPAEDLLIFQLEMFL